MESARRTLAGASLACALTLAGAALPVSAALAALEEGAPVPAARAIPVAPVDPGSTVGRIVLAIADWLEQRFGSEAKALRLSLDDPMWAEQENSTVTVHLPGARLVEPSTSRLEWLLGDLAVAITPRDETTYEFAAALPPIFEGPNERLEIGEGSISGTWRSDLEITTRVEASANNLHLFEVKGESAVLEASLASLTATDTLAQDADGLWKGRSAFRLSGLRSQGLLVDKLDVTSSFEGVDVDFVRAMRGELGPSTEYEGVPEVLPEGLGSLFASPWGRSDLVITVQGLTVTGGDWGLSGDDEFALGWLFWRIDLDDRGEHTDLATKIAAVELMVSGASSGDLPPALIPHKVTFDVALNGVPIRQIGEAFVDAENRSLRNNLNLGSFGDALLAQMDAADTSLEIREIHVVAPSFELRAHGSFNVEPASLFGVIGRMEARIRGFDGLMALALEEDEEDAVAFLILLQGLGRPVFEEGASEPFYAYEIDLRRDGAVTVNGIPFDMLLEGDLSPQ